MRSQAIQLVTKPPIKQPALIKLIASISTSGASVSPALVAASPICNAGGKTAIHTVTPAIAKTAAMIIKPDWSMATMRWAGR